MRQAFDDIYQQFTCTKEEAAYFEKRFSKFSVQETLKLEGMLNLYRPKSAEDLINLMEQFDHIELYYGLDTPEKLGSYLARTIDHVKASALPFVRCDKIAQNYLQKHNGTLVEHAYAEAFGPLSRVYDGKNLSSLSGGDCGIKIKVASPAYPDGLWIDFPAYDNVEGAENTTVYLDILEVEGWDECTFLEGECCFSDIEIQKEGMDTLADLIWNAMDFGYVYAERGQGQAFFMEKWQSAIELEHCKSLQYALDISQNLDCYDFIPIETDLEQYGRALAGEKNLFDQNSATAANFDYAGYVKATCLSGGNIQRNDKEFRYEYSCPPTPTHGPELQM